MNAFERKTLPSVSEMKIVTGKVASIQAQEAARCWPLAGFFDEHSVIFIEKTDRSLFNLLQ